MIGERFLVVGLGSIGRRHAANLKTLRPHCEVAGLHLSGRLHDAGSMPVVARHFTQWDDALAYAPSASVICIPAPFHLDASRRLLKARVPMLIEKPIADRLEGLASLIDEVQRNDLPAVVGYNLRFSPALRFARDAILRGEIGQVLAARAEVGQYLPDWRPQARYQDGVSAQRRLGGGPLLELSHEFDYLQWLFGMPLEVTAVAARVSTLEIDVPDVTDITLRYANPDRLISVHLDFLQRTPARRCRFVGAEGTLLWDGILDTVDVYRAATGEWIHHELRVRDRNQIYLNELAAFLALPSRGDDLLASLKSGYAALSIAEAAAKSIERGTAVRISELGSAVD